MHPSQILTILGERGFRVSFERGTKDVQITPTPNAAMIKRIVANEAAIVGYLETLEHQPALAHPFTVEAGRVFDMVQDLGVCLACGIPWALHGEPPQSSWAIVTNVAVVALVTASPIDGVPE